MTPNEYQELTTFFVDQLGRHQRETLVIVANTRAIEDNSRRIDANGARIDANGARIDALTPRVERLETTVGNRFADHGDRLRALER